ncbi:hypothetical protein DFH08DRAFT_795632 [Mycena albidolilacea]|uniref:Uncharacterized protein n=1 Tax=Mycena albidolilacea TaxID=1033008 RepID=A0AAD7ASX7_9AGAR|nr:hypothetical protein DFH08DRAFT_795632 [Mycena albidolilacea]
MASGPAVILLSVFSCLCAGGLAETISGTATFKNFSLGRATDEDDNGAALFHRGVFTRSVVGVLPLVKARLSSKAYSASSTSFGVNTALQKVLALNGVAPHSAVRTIACRLVVSNYVSLKPLSSASSSG